MAKTVLPASINKAINVKALDDLIAERFGNLDTSVVVLQLIDTCPVVALPYLAEEYGILGYRGWKFADTELKQREMLKQAFELHRYRGTPWAIKNALRLVGIIGGVTIKENLTITLDGSWVLDGYVFLGYHIAYFRVLIDLANLNGIPIADIKGVINEYKRATQWLFDVSFHITAIDKLQVTETLNYITMANFQSRLQISETFTKRII